MLFLLLAILKPAQAQLIPDNTLGLENSIVSPQATQSLITGGAIRGNHLFHSFQQFNIDAGKAVRFNPASNIANIFSRVTGATPSNIQGVLGVIGNANLFLLNPNGILFGPNAQLNLAGSFTATTATSFQFGSETFSAVTPQAAPLLSISAPIGYNFGNNPGTIINRSTANGTGLTVQPFRSIALLGGDINLTGGRITASDGQIRLSSLGQITLSDQATLTVNGIVGNLASEISLTSNAIRIDGQSEILSQNRSATPGGNITLSAENLIVMDGSQISATTRDIGNGGNITATISETITVSSIRPNGNIGLSSQVVSETLGPGTAGHINLQTGQLIFEYDSRITNQSRAFTTGNTGNITIQASGAIIGQRLSPVTRQGGYISVISLGYGSGGTLKLTTPQLILRDAHTISNASWLAGSAGDIVIDTVSIQLDNVNPFLPYLSSGIDSIAYGTGKGGNIQIKTQDLTIQNSASITTAVLANRDEVILGLPTLPEALPLLGLTETGLGNAGNIKIIADTILVDGFSSLAASRPSQISSISLGNGNAGDVDINTRKLRLTMGGVVASSSLFSFSVLGLPVANSGLGNGGDLQVTADQINVTGINSLTDLPSLLGSQTGSLGNAGSSTIATRRLNVGDGGAVLSGTFTSGNAGPLKIKATESIVVEGIHLSGQPSTIGTFAAAPSLRLQQSFFLPSIPTGNTGQLILDSDRLTITNGGRISVAHQGNGNAGNLQININQLRLAQNSQIIATSRSGRGGDVNLQVSDVLLLRNNSQITSASVGSQGNGGNLNISAGNILAIPTENSDIIASAIGGNGGNINIQTNTLLGLQPQLNLTNQSDITASSTLGIDGQIEINQLVNDPTQATQPLPNQLLDPNQKISTVCNRFTKSRFILSGKGGIPVDPRQQFESTVTLQDWRVSASRISHQLPQAQAPPIVEAQTWQKNRQGTIKLISGTIPPRPTCSTLSKTDP